MVVTPRVDELFTVIVLKDELTGYAPHPPPFPPEPPVNVILFALFIVKTDAILNNPKMSRMSLINIMCDH
jgi:hypothetical protein